MLKPARAHALSAVTTCRSWAAAVSSTLGRTASDPAPMNRTLAMRALLEYYASVQPGSRQLT